MNIIRGLLQIFLRVHSPDAVTSFATDLRPSVKCCNFSTSVISASPLYEAFQTSFEKWSVSKLYTGGVLKYNVTTLGKWISSEHP